MLLDATEVNFKSGDSIQVQSAGPKPSTVNPFAIEAMQERGISMDSHRSKDMESIEPGSVDLIITLCAEEVCPSQFGETLELIKAGHEASITSSASR